MCATMEGRCKCMWMILISGYVVNITKMVNHPVPPILFSECADRVVGSDNGCGLQEYWLALVNTDGGAFEDRFYLGGRVFPATEGRTVAL